jgi:hypothetical protein
MKFRTQCVILGCTEPSRGPRNRYCCDKHKGLTAKQIKSMNSRLATKVLGPVPKEQPEVQDTIPTSKLPSWFISLEKRISQLADLGVNVENVDVRVSLKSGDIFIKS